MGRIRAYMGRIRAYIRISYLNLASFPKFANSIFFFFKQKTAYEISEWDWSSDVCSSDLHERGIETIRDFLHTIWLSRVDLLTCYFTSSRHLFCYTNATTMINGCNTRQSSSTYVCQTH